jgi:hypothetical protein
MNAFRTITTLIAVSALTAACGDSPTGMNVARSELPLAEAPLANGQSARRVALIAHFGDPVLIEAPARTTVGTPTDVYVTTYEGGCNREDVVASEVIGLRALVVPYRLVPTDPNVVCTAELLITVDGVIHYGVANMPGAVPRTSTLALTNATMPYAVQLANKGWKAALRDNAALRKGLNMTGGVATYQAVADSFGLPYQEAELFLGS